jgi:hypothetical protein
MKVPFCPECKGETTYIHDLKCPICDNQRIVWCPKCQVHIQLDPKYTGVQTSLE